MFKFLSTKAAQPVTAQIDPDDVCFTVNPGQTLLQAALAGGMEFPHNCRVGSCGTCKCQLLEGKVKQLTDSSYILTAQELSLGFILACQSQPKTSIRVFIDHFGELTGDSTAIGDASKPGRS